MFASLPKPRWSILVCLLTAGLFMALLLAGCRSATPPVTDPQSSTEPKTTPAGETIPTGETTPAGETKPPVPLSPITNLPVSCPGSPVAVSTDNYPDARPQSGLAKADIVYEVLAEGGITRYLAVYYSEAPATVGPVRSARPYFALLAKEWGAVFAHCGGDPKDIEPIREWNVVDGDEFRYGNLYWRDNSRKAPHNLYTSIENMRKVPEQEIPAPEKRYEFQEWEKNPSAGLEIQYGRNYTVQYRYNDKKYERVILDGSREPFVYHDLGTNEKPAVSNVIVQFAETRVAYSDGGLIIDLIGEGKAVYLLGGRYSEGTWKKESVDKPTWFFTAEGEKITLTTGQTWVQVVPSDAKVTELTAK
jgi:hypothetical protein